MKQIIIIRHGESEGNNQNIIQGKEKRYHLTEKGKKKTVLMIQYNFETLKFAQKIISSDLNRAKETAKIIAKELCLPLEEDKGIGEIETGILTGMKQEEANKGYPSYYRIWKEKQDLDPIPGAEKGEELQARAIGFMMKYYDKEEYCDIVVSHAGFIRCLVNTVKGKERTCPVSIGNNECFVLEDIFSRIQIEKRERAMNSKVLIISTKNGKYVVKLKEGCIRIQDYAEQCLLDKIGCEGVPKILLMQNYKNGTFCKIIKHVEGKHIYGRLGEEEYNELIRSEERLGKILGGVKNASRFFKTIDLEKEIDTIYHTTSNDYIKKTAKELLSSRYCKELNSSENILSHNDINRDNVLFEKMKDGKIRANIIDFESLEISPKGFQFASMLASGMLLEGEQITRIRDTIQRKGEDYEKILFYMQIRLLEGLHFFQQKIEKEHSNREISKALMKKYYYSSELIQKEIKKAQTKNKGRDER